MSASENARTHSQSEALAAARRVSAQQRTEPAQPEESDDAVVARKMLLGGLACLPWLWGMLLLRYHKELLDKNADPRLRRYLFLAALGFCISTILFLVWIIVFQTSYSSSPLLQQGLVWQPTTWQWWLY